MFKFSPCLHLKTWELAASVSGEGADGPEADEAGEPGLLCLVLSTFQPGVKGGLVVGCGSMQVEGGAEGGSVDRGVATELNTTCRSSLGARVTSMMSASTWVLVLDVKGSCSENES